MTWSDFHKASEEAAVEAEQAMRQGNSVRAELLYAKAAEHEQLALSALDVSKVRSFLRTR
jgi:hypothetical protein